MIKRIKNYLIRTLAVIFLFAAFSVFLFACGKQNKEGGVTTLPIELDVETICANNLKSAFTLSAGTKQGSGFVASVKAGSGSSAAVTCVTNFHVVKGTLTEQNPEAKKIKLSFLNGYEVADAALTAYSTYHDIAILTFEATDFNGLPVSLLESTASEGRRIFAAGNPSGGFLGVFDGCLSRVDCALSVPAVVPVHQITVDINQGMSGSYVFDDGGKFVGVGSYQYLIGSNPYPSMSYAVPSEIVNAILKKAESGARGEVKTLGVQYFDSTTIDFGSLNFDGRIQTKAGASGILVASTVAQPAPSASAALAAGDLITKINGVEILRASIVFGILNGYLYKSVADADQILLSENPLRLTVKRGVSEFEIVIENLRAVKNA